MMAMYCAQLTHKHIILLDTYNTLAHVTLYIAQASIFSLHANIQTHVQNADLQTKKKKPDCAISKCAPNLDDDNYQKSTYSDLYQLFMVQL
jgi:hypothetical protein